MEQGLLRRDALMDMDGFIEKQLHFLKPVETCWQPSDVLPNMAAEDWDETVKQLRLRASALSDELLVILVGNLVTEEALPSYQTWLNRPAGFKDETGVSPAPWAVWTRSWTAEENRHGEVLNKYLYLSGRVDMRSVELTTQYLIRNGFDLKSGNDPYQSIVYVAFQERATKISHANTGKLAERDGDQTLGKICALIASDEARHEEAYKRFFGCVVEADPSAAVIAFARMMRQKIAMPARLMSDGTDRNLFNQFAVVAQKSGVYTTRDYAAIIKHLVEFWNIAGLLGLSSEATQSQEFLCGLEKRYLDKADRIEEAVFNLPREPFRWIFDRCA
ncbi:MAG: acyl-ACP desaturase [Candidatus Omnitrophica bacterium]|nr:acyl-ACP desaturase [Candidatus Omnitrophota bacterium]